MDASTKRKFQRSPRLVSPGAIIGKTKIRRRNSLEDARYLRSSGSSRATLPKASSPIHVRRCHSDGRIRLRGRATDVRRPKAVTFYHKTPMVSTKLSHEISISTTTADSMPPVSSTHNMEISPSPDKTVCAPITNHLESEQEPPTTPSRTASMPTLALDVIPPPDQSPRRRSSSASKCSIQLNSTHRSRNPGNLSLDLSQVETPSIQSFSCSGPRHRREQVAQCSKITDFLFVGGVAVAKDKQALRQQRITHIVNCAAKSATNHFPDTFHYYDIHLHDHASEDLACHFYHFFDYVENVRRSGGKVFVHCVKGISRSPTMAIAYLMWHKRLGMYSALDFIRQARPVVSPNAGFIFQLTEWEHLHLRTRRLQKAVVFRVEAPGEDERHGERTRPLIVGPLGNTCEQEFRAPSKKMHQEAFILVNAGRMFLWCGLGASASLIKTADYGAGLLQKYESMPEKEGIVWEGREPDEFWQLVQTIQSEGYARSDGV